MSHCYVIRNQLGHYISKQREWVDGRDGKVLYRTAHHDEAINLVFELSAKDINLRAQTLRCELDDKLQPQVEVSQIALPMAINADRGALEAEQSEGEQHAEASADSEAAIAAPDDQ